MERFCGFVQDTHQVVLLHQQSLDQIVPALFQLYALRDSLMCEANILTVNFHEALRGHLQSVFREGRPMDHSLYVDPE